MNNRIFAWTEHSVNKIILESPLPSVMSNEYTVCLSRGESEGAQLVFYCEDHVDGLSIRFSSNADDISVCIYRQRFQLVEGKNYADPLIPYSGEKFSLQGGVKAPFFLEFTTKASTKAGKYDYTFELISDESVIADFSVTVKVWNFVLPNRSCFATSVGMSRGDINRYYGYDDDALYLKYYEAMLDHNMTPFHLPYDILDPRADAYMSDSRVTAFMLDPCADDDTLTAIYNKLKTNHEWLKKAYFIPLDEPREPEHVSEFKALSARLKRICPEIRITAPFYVNIQIDERDEIDHLSEYVDLWCPKLCLWDYEMVYNEEQIKKSPPLFADRMAKMKDRGDSVWCYICNAPNHPYLNIWVDGSGIEHRLLFWQQYQRKIEGFLYWAASCWFWPKPVKPFESVDTGMLDDKGKTVYGEGLLIYPGIDVEIDDPVVSYRMKMIRDGVDDFRLFVLASSVLGEDFVLERIASVTPNLTEITSEPDAVVSIRKELGDAIERAICT